MCNVAEQNLPTVIGVKLRQETPVEVDHDARIKQLQTKLELKKMERMIAQEETALKTAIIDAEMKESRQEFDAKMKESRQEFDAKMKELAITCQLDKDAREKEREKENMEFNKLQKQIRTQDEKDHYARTEAWNVSLNQRPHRMTINSSLLMEDEMEVVGTVASPSLLVNEFKPAFFKLLNKTQVPETRDNIYKITEDLIDQLTVTTSVFDSASRVNRLKTISIADSMVMMSDYVGPSCGVNKEMISKEESIVFKHHGIRHATDLTLSEFQDSTSISCT
jgi:hypothetical protein